MNRVLVLVYLLAASAGMISDTRRTVAAVALSNCLEEDSHIGLAKGKTPEEANANAIKICVKSGDTKDCCEVYVTINNAPSSLKKACLAAAQGASGDFGFGIGQSEKAAVSAAVASCKHNAIGPSECKVKDAAICQD